jgi:hypothetical protein
MTFVGLSVFLELRIKSKQLIAKEKSDDESVLYQPCVTNARYNILNPNITKEKDGTPMDEKKASSNLLDESKLDVSLFRLGHTKARCLVSFACEPNRAHTPRLIRQKSARKKEILEAGAAFFIRETSRKFEYHRELFR